MGGEKRGEMGVISLKWDGEGGSLLPVFFPVAPSYDYLRIYSRARRAESGSHANGLRVMGKA